MPCDRWIATVAIRNASEGLLPLVREMPPSARLHAKVRGVGVQSANSCVAASAQTANVIRSKTEAIVREEPKRTSEHGLTRR